MPDIFLSYNREDAGVAKLYADAFAAAGLTVWWDATLRSGEAYDEVTEAALNGAKAVVVLWSPRSVSSRWVRAEATVADQNKTLAPVTIEACRRPVMFELTQTADLAHWRGAADDTAWLAFLSDVRRMVGRGEAEGGQAKPAPMPASTSVGSGAPAIVAVLPFTHRADDDEMEVLAEDLTEEITRELARNRLYSEVIAAGTMAAWRGQAINHRALGQELGARYLIEGKLQRASDAVRLTAQLIDAATGRMLWSARIVRKLGDIAAAPEEFPLVAAAQLNERISHIEVTRAMAQAPPCSAWDHLLRCMGYLGHGGMESMARCVEEARQAVAAAPDLGLAHAMLALVLGAEVHSGIKELDDGLGREIRTHVMRALQLDGDDFTVISHLAAAYRALGDDEASLRLALRAAEHNPTFAGSYGGLGMAYLELGRTAEALAAFAQQERLTSYFAIHYAGLARLGLCHLLEGQLKQAEAAADRSLALQPDYDFALALKAMAQADRGEEPAALATVRRLREAEPSKTIDQYARMLGRNPHIEPRMAEHIATLRRLWEASGGDA